MNEVVPQALTVPRFWGPEGSEIPLLDVGFMPDPSGRWTGAYVPEMAELSELSATSCLVLIGEPGLGKTTALKSEFARISSQLGPEDRAYFVPLGITRDRHELETRIFEARPFQEWLDGEGRLHLFLDSLDEARVHITKVADLLLEGLADVPLSRLALRLTCRSADRHRRLESELEARFSGKEEFQVRELAPLRKRDVLDLANDQGLNGDEVLRAVIERDLQPLAMIPESLGFLLDSVSRSGQLPDSRVDAYRSGLLALVEEGDEDRRRDGQSDVEGAGARLALASRIAAGLVLSGRSSVRTDGASPGADEATPAQLAGGFELDRAAAIPPKVEASAGNLVDVLRTSLFTGHGESRFGFAQASYGQYLCASWLASGALSPVQVEDLLFIATDGGLRVVPQLREIATWLAALDEHFFRRLLDQDPTVLLRADPTGLDDDGRRRLVDALLAGVSNHEVERWDRRQREGYGRLVHPGLPDQLRGVIFDSAATPFARQVACDVAGVCELVELEGELVDLAVDVSVDMQVRIAALSAQRAWPAGPERGRLRPLALESAVDDRDDELKGAALRVLWPDLLSAEELFGCLTSPKRESLFGLYKGFFLTELLEELDPADLPTALRWAAQLPVDHRNLEPLSDLREQLLIKAWPHLQAESPVLTPFVEVVATLLEGEGALLEHQKVEANPDVFAERAKRHLVLSELFARAPMGQFASYEIVQSRPPLLRGEDADWLVEQLKAAKSGEAEELCARVLLAHVSFGGGSERVLLEARDTNDLLRRISAGRYDPIRLDSKEAARAREIYAMHKRDQREDEEEPDPLDIAGNARASLKDFEDGDPDGFWVMTKWLEIHPARQQRDFFTSELADLPGWDLLDEKDRVRARNAALHYLDQSPPEPSSWFGRNSINWPATAGYRALRSVHEQDREAAEKLPADVWVRWAPIIVDWWRNDGEGRGEGEFNDWAISSLLARAPEVAVSWFERRLDRDLRGEGMPFILHRFRHVWHPLLERAILHRARRTRLTAEQRTELLRVLLRNESVAGRAHACRLVTPSALATAGRRRELAVRTAALLAIETEDGEWGRIWPLVLADQRFGEELVERLSWGEHQVMGLSPKQAGELYTWILERYPPAKDPMIEGAHSVSSREQVGHWRDRIPHVIASQGTRDAVQELARLATQHPALIHLVRLRREAEDLQRESEWVPPSPEAVIVLADDASRRHVRDATDLQEVLVSSLLRAQGRLSGTRSVAHLLWDTRSSRPKAEGEVAVWLEEHLRQDLIGRGIIVDREVDVRPHPKGKKGKSVDFLVTAVVGPEVEDSPLVSVSIELKCCWHEDLDTAMRGQLVRFYLDAENREGIYLIAYFDGPEWSDRDRRNRSRCRRRTVLETREFFEDQASKIGEEGLGDVVAFVLDCSP